MPPLIHHKATITVSQPKTVATSIPQRSTATKLPFSLSIIVQTPLIFTLTLIITTITLIPLLQLLLHLLHLQPITMPSTNPPPPHLQQQQQSPPHQPPHLSPCLRDLFMHAYLVVMVLLVVPLLLTRIIIITLVVHSVSRDVSRAPLVEAGHIPLLHSKMFFIIIISQLEYLWMTMTMVR